MKIENNTYAFNHEVASRADLFKQMENVAKPFRITMKTKGVTLEILQDDSVPANLS